MKITKGLSVYDVYLHLNFCAKGKVVQHAKAGEFVDEASKTRLNEAEKASGELRVARLMAVDL